MPKGSEPAIQALQGLRKKCKLNKDRHFAAGDRKTFYQTWVGLPVILINVFVGTVLVQFMGSGQPPQWASISATVLAFLAASLSSVQTFFNFSKMAEGHRMVANRYLRTMMQCENLLLRLASEQISMARAWELIDSLTLEYDEVNVEAGAFPTNARDFRKATRRDSLVPFKLEAAERLPSDEAPDQPSQ